MKTKDELKQLSKNELIALLMGVSREPSSAAPALSLIQDERDTYKFERDDYKAKLERSYAERDRLRAIIVKLERHQFGRRSERLSPDQLQLALEDLTQTLAAIEAKEEVKAGQLSQDEESKQEKKPREPRNNNRGALPDHLPREHRFIEPEEKVCPCCNGALHVIGEETSEQLDRVPATLKVVVTHRPKYGCRACEGAVVQAPAPERPITGGMATEALLAHVLVSKYGDHRVPRTHQERWRCEAV